LNTNHKYQMRLNSSFHTQQ